MNFWDKVADSATASAGGARNDGGGFSCLAPMEGVTDVVFRQVVARAGRPDVFFTEFTNVSSYASDKGRANAVSRLRFLDDEMPIVAQIWGSNVEHFEIAAGGLVEMGYTAVDINMGCPERHVVASGGGSGLIRTPELAGEIIAAVKKSGLAVSVKTRLGYSRVEEWREWLSFLLGQDLAALTVHLRTKKEMSKVTAHDELVPGIVALRDEIAPGTKLIVNGDIADVHDGRKFIEMGADGIMIGRGVFNNPFCFRSDAGQDSNHLSGTASGAPYNFYNMPVGPRSIGPDKQENLLAAAGDVVKISPGLADGPGKMIRNPVLMRLELFEYHLDLFDEYNLMKFDPLKRFFKIYVNNFAGASEWRERMMECRSTSEVRGIIREIKDMDPATAS